MLNFLPFNSNYLYYTIEAIRAQMEPLKFSSMMMLELLEDKNNSFYRSDYARIMRASLEMSERITRRYQKPSFGIRNTVIDEVIYKVEKQSLLTKSFCRLQHFVKIDFPQPQPKLLIVAPMAGHHATLLRATIQDTIPFFDVYVTDWVNANQVPLEAGKFDMDDFIDYVIEFVRSIEGEVNILAVCQPTVPVIAAVSIMSAENDPKLPKSMILMGGPVDASKNPTIVNNFATGKSLEWFENTVIAAVPPNYPGYKRLVYPGFMQLAGFMSLNLQRHTQSHIDMFSDLISQNIEKAQYQQKFYNEYFSVMDLPAEFYLQTIKEVFQKFSLAKGQLVSRDRNIIPSKIVKCAVMGIEGDKDDISGIGQTEAALGLCSGVPSSMKKYYLQKGVGHYGVFSGSKFRQFIVPEIRNFIYNL
ncbi:MAG: polyhydroxyalkanoate depolymerase [Rickettsiaceae bacterium]|nr:MAG: polyhydroxyalkanoate depolymerase [Rickettsiaceae bacterium]